ncbi:MAG: carbohydrate binding domain-containing protein [Candidatus Hydrogenedentes bacterium]|nr:carbohydrate binding domain-containing protein [Candidatus Hydrogenedentota bacterium]
MRYSLSIALAIAGAAAMPAAGQVSDETPGYFPFWIPALDTSASFTDMAFLSPEPAGAAGRVTVADGHFCDCHGNRLRLLGTNLCFLGAFPEKENAAAIAGHLRKLGINVVRFHHIDGRTDRGGIWLPEQTGFNPEQLDRLDWLIHQLKEHGVYINLNLHVSRTYPGMPKDGPRAFRYGKGLDNFYPDFIRLQQEYARALLGHRNPYTGATYAEEPAVIVVELNNENALTNVGWHDLRAMPEPYHSELTRQWRAWLKARYGSTETLRARWDASSEPLGDELLANGGFQEGVKGWVREQGGGSQMAAETAEDAGAASGRALVVTTLKPGRESWSLQVYQTGRNLEAGAPYTFTFRARADAACDIDLSVMLDRAPWHGCGLRERASISEEWQTFSYTFQCVDPEPNHCRVGFNFRNRIGQFALADVSLRRGGLVGLGLDQSLEANNIPLAPSNAGDAQKEDFWQFLYDTECAYVRSMRKVVKEELGVQAAVCDTQASYGGLFGTVREGTYSDYTDMHSYWQHPQFPGKPWDGGNWHIGNTSMVAQEGTGTLGRLAWARNVHKPYTVSEYDHPAPSDYAVELFPVLASFAAFQDWDGIYQFCYRSCLIGDEPHKLSGYFELWCHPGKQVFLPIAALMFRMGAVRAGDTPCVASIPTGGIAHEVVAHPKAVSDLSALAPVALVRPVGIRLTEGPGPLEIPAVEPPVGARKSESGEIVWDSTDPAQAAYTVNAPAVRAAVGFIGGRAIRLGDVTIQVTGTEGGWAAVAVGALDGKPIAESGRILVVAAGRVENTGMGWNEARTSVLNRWGQAPAVAEGITATIRLPAGAEANALDGTGTPKGGVPLAARAGGVELAIGPEYETLWYGVTR